MRTGQLVVVLTVGLSLLTVAVVCGLILGPRPKVTDDVLVRAVGVNLHFAYGDHVRKNDALPDGSVQTLYKSSVGIDMPLNPWTRKPFVVGQPGDEVGPGNFILVPAKMQQTTFDWHGDKRVNVVTEAKPAYYLLQFGDHPHTDSEGYFSNLDQDWEFLRDNRMADIDSMWCPDHVHSQGWERIELEPFL
ncbi:MAG: hypothetical protein M3R04_05970, partial [bacterium]|nr:hypothetical protein [bacterium]